MVVVVMMMMMMTMMMMMMMVLGGIGGKWGERACFDILMVSMPLL